MPPAAASPSRRWNWFAKSKPEAFPENSPSLKRAYPELSTHARFDHAEAAGRINCGWMKAAIIEQPAVLLFGALEAAGPAQHIQVAHGLCPICVAGARQFPHPSFNQQQRTSSRQGLTAIPEDHRTAFIVPIVNHAFEDDGIGELWNGIEEIAGDEKRAVTYAHTFHMSFRGI